MNAPNPRTAYSPLVNCRFYPGDSELGCQRACTSCWDHREARKLLAAPVGGPYRVERSVAETMEVHRLAARLRDLGVDTIRLTDGAPVVAFAA
ncbi:MAG: hypothetical protein OXP36_05305 [Gammaproteobacteria bacterium]|nr:hypothetical protein [Gammaproteobacteria bacterium]